MSSKKLFVFVLASVMTLLPLSGTAMAAAKEKPVTFKMCLTANAGSQGRPGYHLMHDFVNKLNELSSGRIKGAILPAGTMGSEREITEAIQLGMLDVANVSDVGIDSVLGKIGFAWLPFMITTYEAADKYYNSGWIHDEIVKLMRESGIVKIGNSETGFKVIGNTKRAINTFDDFKGLKIRTAEAADIVAYLQLVGILPVAISATETLTALEQGTVDGAETTLVNLKIQGVLDSMKYVTKTYHQYTGGSIIASERFWKSLTDADKEIFYQAARFAGDNHIKMTREQEKAAEKEAVANGIAVSGIDEDISREMKKAALQLWDTYKKIYDPKYMDKIIQEFGI